MSNLFTVLICCLLMASSVLAQTTIRPATTLAAETGNNTSTANSFRGLANGTPGASNVSKVSLRTLLYPGSNAKIYAHYMAWFGTSSHQNIGYSSTDKAQVHRQVSDMMSRGIDGMIIDWYGTGDTRTDASAKLVKADAETRGGKFQFAIMEDQGAVHTCAYTSGCDVTQKLINDLNYINNTYAKSPAYVRVDGQPVIYTFDVENLPNIDWARVMANAQGNPKLILHNAQGFRKSFTSGGYSWVPINKSNPNDWGQAYLDYFYATSKSYPNMETVGGVWKGFNDNAAGWGQNRVVNQNCGETWLATFKEMERYFSSSNQVPAIQLVTWNDYEEGSELETGIDNCVSVSGSSKGSVVYWSLDGNQEMLNHYTVFISKDGKNLMPLKDVSASTYQLDLSDFGLAQGNYTVHVKAVGKPNMLNHMSSGIPVTIGSQSSFAVKVTSPSTSGTVASNVHFVATGNSATAMRIYVDGVSAYTVNAGKLDKTLTLAGGTHDVVIQAWNQAGAVAKAPLTVNVGSPTPAATRGVKILAPTTATQKSPVRIAGTAASDHPITGFRIYVDDQAAYTVNTGSIDAEIAMRPGTHHVVLQAWDSTGKVFKAPVSVTVK
jgi:hypothetical protein